MKVLPRTINAIDIGPFWTNRQRVPSEEFRSLHPGRPNEWANELADLADRCGSAAVSPVEILERSYRALTSAPNPIPETLRECLPPSEFRSLIDAGAFESVAMRMAQASGQFMFSWSEQGGAIATIILLGSERECHFDAQDLSMAMCGSILTALHLAAG